MMQFLKSILSKNRTEDNKNEVRLTHRELKAVLDRIDQLELDVSNMYEQIAELSVCVRNVALAASNLSSDVMYVTSAIQQATEMAEAAHQKEHDRALWFHDDGDDEGYLN